MYTQKWVHLNKNGKGIFKRVFMNTNLDTIMNLSKNLTNEYRRYWRFPMSVLVLAELKQMLVKVPLHLHRRHQVLFFFFKQLTKLVHLIVREPLTDMMMARKCLYSLSCYKFRLLVDLLWCTFFLSLIVCVLSCLLFLATLCSLLSRVLLEVSSG